MLRKFVCLFVIAISILTYLKDIWSYTETVPYEGNIVETRRVATSSSVVTVISPPYNFSTLNASTPTWIGSTCFNNSSYTIYLGTNVPGVAVSTGLYSFGIPITSSTSFKLGKYEGRFYAQYELAAPPGSQDLRCWDEFLGKSPTR